MKGSKVLVLPLIVALLVSTACPLFSAAEIVAADKYHVQFKDGINSHLDDLARYGDFLVLYELLKTFEPTLTPGQDFTFTNDIRLPVEIRWGKYSTGGSGSLKIDGKVVLGFADIPVLEGTLEFIADIVVINGDLSQTEKEELHIETTASVRMSLFKSEQEELSEMQTVELHVGGLHAPAKTTTDKTTYYKDGRKSSSQRTGSSFGAGFMFKYSAAAEHLQDATPEPEEETIFFSGRIVDYADRPMKHMVITIIDSNGQTYTGTTDASGVYSIKAEGLDTRPSSYTITTLLRYKKDDKEYFDLALTLAGTGYYLNTKKTVIVNNASDLHCDYVLSKNHTSQGFASLIRPDLLDNITTVYHYMSQVVEFYESLGLYKEFNIPSVLVFCYDNSQGGTLYYPGRGIYIDRNDMENTSPEAPHNREWHEYNHHVMYSIYGKWPEGVPDGYRRNHAGFLNDSTADSYMEGFAEFMALVTGDYYDLGNGPIYAPIANMDLYYKPWEWRGAAEELSVAAILWKLYDGIYAQEVGSSLETLWPILKTYSKDFGEVYERLVAAHPSKQGTIDALLISHGFFSSSQVGNGEHDNLEPFIDRNTNRRYDQGDSFIDLPLDEQGNISVRYEPGAKVGYAADAGRTDRRSPLSPQGHFVKTDSPVPYYTVEYAFAEHPEFNYQVKTRNKEGYIAVVVPPSEYISTITVKPSEVSHDNPLTFSSAEFYTNYSQSIAQGSFIEHDFKITGSIAPLGQLPSSVLSEALPYPLQTVTGEIITAPAAVTPTTPEPQDKDTIPVITDPNHSKPQRNKLYVVVPIVVIIAVGILVVVFKLKR